MSDDLRAAEREAAERYEAARAAESRARSEWNLAIRAMHDAEAIAEPPFDVMTIDALREHVADMARMHGARCVGRGAVETTAAWRAFRKALAALAARAT